MTTAATRILAFALALMGVFLAAPTVAGASDAYRFNTVVDRILTVPYQPDYVPEGNDGAFGSLNVKNTFPVEDYTSGSRQGSPDAPPWPAHFKQVLIHSLDRAPLLARLSLRSGKRPGVVVVHGFNSNANDSVVRWAAMLAARGYNVLAADLRNFPPEYRAGYGHPNWKQTLGWKEGEDVLAAGRFLARQPGVTSVGVMGFSLGGQATVLALALDGKLAPWQRVFKAGLNFSGPADQNTQIYSTAAPPNCFTPFCTYPATSALIQIVVPPFTYNDPCRLLSDAATYYRTTPYAILSRENAFHKQTGVRVPLLNLYAQDDPLVLPFHATMMAGYNGGNPLQRTVLLERGLHAYYYDRWWQQRAILLYFEALLPGAKEAGVGVWPSVNQTPGGSPMREQLVPLGNPTRAQADSFLAPYICDTSQLPPGGAS